MSQPFVCHLYLKFPYRITNELSLHATELDWICDSPLSWSGHDVLRLFVHLCCLVGRVNQYNRKHLASLPRAFKSLVSQLLLHLSIHSTPYYLFCGLWPGCLRLSQHPKPYIFNIQSPIQLVLRWKRWLAHLMKHDVCLLYLVNKKVNFGLSHFSPIICHGTWLTVTNLGARPGFEPGTSELVASCYWLGGFWPGCFRFYTKQHIPNIHPPTFLERLQVQIPDEPPILSQYN